MNVPSTLVELFAEYDNTTEWNDAIWSHFTSMTDTQRLLKSHRDYIEQNSLGFGDRAFHYMWFLLLDYVARNVPSPHLLEIGVYKGQVISLWSLISMHKNIPTQVHGVSPLSGSRVRPKGIWDRLLRKALRSYRELASSANLYANEDYKATIMSLYDHFALDFSKVDLIKGYSSDEEIIEGVRRHGPFAMVYIDGDHRFEAVASDIRNYAPLVCGKGFLVIDDASCNLPGTMFWKGHQSVSDACEFIDTGEFKNVLNVGHNRIFQRNVTH